jgi:hypothetical protein
LWNYQTNLGDNYPDREGFQSSLLTAMISKRGAGNGKYPPGTGLLVSGYIINGLTTVTDPNQKYSVSAWMTGMC